MRSQGSPCFPLDYGAALNSNRLLQRGPSPLVSSVPSRSFLSWITGGASAITNSNASAAESVAQAVPEPAVEQIEKVSGYFEDQGAYISTGLSCPDTSADVLWKIDAAGGYEASFSSLGLTGYTPWGLANYCLEFVHSTCGLPWWGTIITVAVAIRLVSLPAYIYGQKNAALMNTIQPEVNRLNMREKVYKAEGDIIRLRETQEDLKMVYKNSKASPNKNLVSALFQLPLFVGAMVGIRQCATLPVKAFMTGGVLWIQDLTVPDPYFILPMVTALSQFLVIKVSR